MCNQADETTVHFLLDCSNFSSKRVELLSLLNDILFMNDIEEISLSDKTKILLYGHENFLFEENKMILKSTIRFINKTGRFSTDNEENS